MGNQILTKFEVTKEAFYYGTDLKWRLHAASFKDKPEEKLTIFLFEKKAVDKYPKTVKESILDGLRKDASSLQRLRHPGVLSVVEALTEERSTLAFATKSIVGTVSQLLENNRHELSLLEMKCGLLDAAEALQFLHQDAKTAHLSLSPSSIFIDPQGKWLLGGLGNSISGLQWGGLVDCPFAFCGGEQPGTLSHEPSPRYSSPEMCNLPGKCGLESDMFSLGLLTYELMSTERQPLLRGAPRGFMASQVRQSSVPHELYPVLTKLLSPTPAERMTVAAFIASDFFMDVNVRAIRFLEQLNEKDEAQRVTFLRGLPKLLADPNSAICAHRILRERVLPRLCAATMFPSLYGYVVPNIITLLKKDKVTDCSHFQAKVWPTMKPLFSAKEIPIEVVTLFLKELELLVTFTSSDQTQEVLLPFVLRCLELQEPIILNEVLEKVPLLHKKFEYRQVKDQILPRMLTLLVGSSIVKVKVQVLMGLSRIFEIFDKSTITDMILVTFEKMTKSDRSPAICMCLLGCYDAMSKHLGPKLTSEKILPLIMPLLVEESLSAEQFDTQLQVCKKLMSRVEAARRKDYETKSALQADVGEALGKGPAVDATAMANAEPLDFESLLMGAKPQPKAAVPQVPVPLLAAPTGGGGGGGGGGDLLGGPVSAPGVAMGGFDPFASSTPSPAFGSGSFDPFAGSAPAAAAAPSGYMGGMGSMSGMSGMPAQNMDPFASMTSQTATAPSPLQGLSFQTNPGMGGVPPMGAAPQMGNMGVMGGMGGYPTAGVTSTGPSNQVQGMKGFQTQGIDPFAGL